MPTVESKERFFDFGVVKKFGIAFEYGQKIYGQGMYGAEEPKIDNQQDTPLERFGIYQRRHNNGKVVYIRENFYIPLNPQSGPQQSWRNTFKSGMEAWALLTDEEKEAYNREANKLHLHGVNLFLKRWLNSY